MVWGGLLLSRGGFWIAKMLLSRTVKIKPSVIRQGLFHCKKARHLHYLIKTDTNPLF